MRAISPYRSCVMNRLAGLQLAIGDALDVTGPGHPSHPGHHSAGALAVLMIELHVEVHDHHLLPAMARALLSASTMQRLVKPLLGDSALLRGLVAEYRCAVNQHDRIMVLSMMRGQLQVQDRHLHMLFTDRGVARADWRRLLNDIDSVLRWRRSQLDARIRSGTNDDEPYEGFRL